MKHAGSREDLLTDIHPSQPKKPPRFAAFGAAGGQSRASLAVCFACALVLVIIVADAPVRDWSRSLDPSLIAVLSVVTEFGNSAWPLGIGLALIASVALVTRQGRGIPLKTLQDFRSVLLFVVGSVALSGFMASLAKNVIGRVRPSTLADGEVLEFAFLSFRAGWASFPSGHATTATACAVALAITFPRQSWAWLSIGLVAALSRAFLGVHWLSDCLAGMALGALVTLGVRHWLMAKGHRFQITPRDILRIVSAAVVVLFRLCFRAAKWMLGQATLRLQRHGVFGRKD
jgi:membrane-associated phospholipid phosphatase